MAKRIEISNDNKTATVYIKNTLSTRIKILFAVKALYSGGGALLFLYVLIMDGFENLFPAILAVAMIILCSVFAFRYLSKITETESIEVNAESMIVKSETIFSKKRQVYDIGKISKMNFSGFEKYTDHPLKGESFDYLGFQTTDKQIQTVHEEGSISFLYAGKIVSFGKRLPSWEAEKINDALMKATNNQLVIDKLVEENIEEN